MTPLRQQLRDARLSYDRASYPGDLADELLPPATHRGSRSGALRLLIGGVLAAATVLSVMHRGGHQSALPTGPVAHEPSRNVHPTPLAYQFPDRVALTLPAPLVPATPPVTVSLTALNSLGQQRYEQLGPMLRQRLTLPGILGTETKPVDDSPIAATQRAV